MTKARTPAPSSNEDDIMSSLESKDFNQYMDTLRSGEQSGPEHPINGRSLSGTDARVLLPMNHSNPIDSVGPGTSPLRSPVSSESSERAELEPTRRRNKTKYDKRYLSGGESTGRALKPIRLFLKAHACLSLLLRYAKMTDQPVSMEQILDNIVLDHFQRQVDDIKTIRQYVAKHDDAHFSSFTD